MSNNFGSIDIILLAMIAGFIILRLRNILGRKTGHEDEVFKGFSEKKFEQFKKENFKKTAEDQNKLEGEQKKQFLIGAQSAYETIITSFAKGDRNQLKPLLSSQMYSNFDSAITQRENENVKSELTFIGIKETKVEHFEKIKNELYATVKFVSEIISVKKDNQNKIIEGNADKIKEVTDHWKFSKNVLSSSPNWYLSEIVSK